MTTTLDDSLLTAQELAERLGVPVSWVYRRAAPSYPDPLPAIRVGAYLRFSFPDVERFLRGGERRAAS